MPDDIFAATEPRPITFAEIAKLGGRRFEVPVLPDGPVANRFESVLAGITSVENAVRRVAIDQREHPLSAQDAATIASSTRHIVHRDRSAAWTLAQLTKAAAEATSALARERRGDLADDALNWVDVAYLRAASEMVRHVPDGRIYQDAVAASVSLLARSGPTAELHADAVCACAHLRSVYLRYGDSVAWWDDPAAWRAQIVDADKRGELTWSSDALPAFVRLRSTGTVEPELRSLLAMPPARQELAVAHDLAEQALDCASGNDHGFSALLILRLARYCGDRLDDGRRAELARTAWDDVDAAKFPDGSLRALHAALTAGADVAVDPATVPRLSLPELRERFGVPTTVGCFETAVHCLQALRELRHTQRLALEMLEVNPRTLAQDSPVRLQYLWERLVHLLDGGALSCEVADACAGDLAALTAAVPVSLDPETRVYAELHAAHHCTAQHGIERLMLAKLRDVPENRRATVIDLRRYVGWFAHWRSVARGGLSAGERLTVGIDILRLAGELGIHPETSTLVLRDLLREEPGRAGAVAHRLLRVWDRFLFSGGDAVHSEVDFLGGEFAAAMARATADNDTCLLLAQMFKGRLSAATVAFAGRLNLSDPATERLVEQTDYVRYLVPTSGTSDDAPTGSLDPELLAFAFTEQQDRITGQSSGDQLANVVRTIDQSWQRTLHSQRVAARLRASALGTRAGSVPLAALLETLDERTALVDLYYSEYDGSEILWAHAYSRSYCNRIGTRYDRAHGYELSVTVGDVRERIKLHPEARALATARRLIGDRPPGSRPVTREAMPLLEDSWLQAIDRHLAELKERGYDRLVIWPQGALHYAPFHVMSLAGGEVLADRWTVTFTPTVDQLTNRRTDLHLEPPIDLLLVAAPDGGRRFAYPSVPGLAEQVDAIAAVTARSEVRVGADSSVAEISALLQSARYVHIAAHGGADPFTPWYQCLYLGDGTVDDRLLAYELLRADLHFAELVTLSACETALGRFDRVDNQAGLMAALFSAGVRAVVACLWAVRPEPSTFFFVQLYSRIDVTASGADGRNDKREAFRQAQLMTREAYPAYRDWGAFVYVGGW